MYQYYHGQYCNAVFVYVLAFCIIMFMFSSVSSVS